MKIINPPTAYSSASSASSGLFDNTFGTGATAGSSPNRTAQSMSPTVNFYRAPTAVNRHRVHPYAFPGGFMIGNPVNFHFNGADRVDVHLHFENQNPAPGLFGNQGNGGNAGRNVGIQANNDWVPDVDLFEELNSMPPPGTNTGGQNGSSSLFAFPSPPASVVSTGGTRTRGSRNAASTTGPGVTTRSRKQH